MEQQASQQPGMKASSASPQQQQPQQQHVQYAVAHGQPAAFQSPAVPQHPGGAGGYPAAPVPMTQAMAYPHRHHQLQLFWKTQMQEIERVTDFKNHQLPLARIKKIMKADEDVRMISAEAPVVFAKACEMFILELTLRSWINTEENKRRTLQKNDIGAAISCTDIYDFLVDIVPRDELKDEGAGVALSSLPVGAPADAFPYGGMYYMPPSSVTPAAGAPGMIPAPGITVGRPAMPVDPALYASQQLPGMPYMTHQPPQHLLQQQQQQQELLPDTSGNPLDSSQAKDGE